VSDAYEADILVWSEEQAALLRRLAAGERVNDRVDWTNVIEEIQSVGNEQLHAVSSLLTQAIIHRLKAIAWPNARDADNWRAEAERFAGDAADRFAPSMLQRLSIAHIYRRALRAVPATMYGEPRPTLPAECPWSLDELLAIESDRP
jgi:3-methyladenine DNA glycosylase AlkC